MRLLSGMPAKTKTSMGPCGDIIVPDQSAGKAGFEDEKSPKFGLSPNSFDGLLEISLQLTKTHLI